MEVSKVIKFLKTKVEDLYREIDQYQKVITILEDVEHDENIKEYRIMEDLKRHV